MAFLITISAVDYDGESEDDISDIVKNVTGILNKNWQHLNKPSLFCYISCTGPSLALFEGGECL